MVCQAVNLGASPIGLFTAGRAGLLTIAILFRSTDGRDEFLEPRVRVARAWLQPCLLQSLRQQPGGLDALGGILGEALLGAAYAVQHVADEFVSQLFARWPLAGVLV